MQASSGQTAGFYAAMMFAFCLFIVFFFKLWQSLILVFALFAFLWGTAIPNKIHE